MGAGGGGRKDAAYMDRGQRSAMVISFVGPPFTLTGFSSLIVVL